MYKRTLQDIINGEMGNGKAIIVYGAWQVGKTTVVKLLLGGRDDGLWLSGDEQDVRSLFENYVVSERLKRLHYAKSYARSYFWRTSSKQEVDYIEEKDGQLMACEFKWNPKKQPSVPKAFASAYPAATFDVVTRDNYDSFLL